jgi:hypothetical protein
LSPSPADRLIDNYRRYLLAELGLALSTVAGYEWHIRKFLLRQCERRRERAPILAV